jgi:hypothetical protein
VIVSHHTARPLIFNSLPGFSATRCQNPPTMLTCVNRLLHRLGLGSLQHPYTLRVRRSILSFFLSFLDCFISSCHQVFIQITLKISLLKRREPLHEGLCCSGTPSALPHYHILITPQPDRGYPIGPRQQSMYKSATFRYRASATCVSSTRLPYPYPCHYNQGIRFLYYPLPASRYSHFNLNRPYKLPP